MMRFFLTTASLFCVALTACGGSDNSAPPPPPPPANAAPSFTSSAMATTAENEGGVVYTAAASDSDDDTLSYTIVAGGDAALFLINSATGELSFAAAPNFERPLDLDFDNIYEFTLSVSDGQGGTDMLAISLTVTDVSQAATLKRVGTDLTQPLFLTPLPGVQDRVLVLQKAGLIRILDPETGVIDSVDFLDINDDIDATGEGGLLGLAFAPDFEISGEFYVNVTATDDFRTEIRKYSLQSGRNDLADPLSKDIIMTFDQPLRNHNAGWIGFDDNGFLVIPTGDGGGSGDPDNFAQNPQSLLGKVLRIDVSQDSFPGDDEKDYAIPSGNTYTDAADGQPEIFALGLRNPYRSSFDPLTGDLLIADVGQNAAEEVSRLPMDDSSLNFGWRVKEATLDFNGSTAATLTPPVIEYLHGTGPREGRSITGGYVYTGPVEALQDQYIFADFISNNVWAVPVRDMQNGTTISGGNFDVLTDTLSPDAGDLSRISSFGLDAQNNLYIVTILGDVFRLEAEN
ncbi:PQQ-dependent sugar dehydrogenase [Hellea sp.]|nr:PQQ-dependent sugar dehydrogenase [Hellea sp.]